MNELFLGFGMGQYEVGHEHGCTWGVCPQIVLTIKFRYKN